MMRHGSMLVAGMIAASSAFVGNSALAQPADAAAAQALFDQGVEEMSAGNFASACPKLEEATRLAPEGGGAKEQLAECYERSGRLASAWSQWNLVAATSARQGNQERLKKAEERAATLKPRLATLTIQVPPAVAGIAGLVIERDGRALSRAEWGAPIPVDRGSHAVVAKAPGRKTSQQDVAVAADGSQLAITIPDLPEGGGTTVTTARPTTGPASGSGGSWQLPVGITGIAVGGVGIILGGVFGGLALSKNGESNDGPCDEETNVCTDEGLDLRDEALTFSYVSTAGIIVGGVLAAAGIVILVTAPSDAPSGPRTGDLKVKVGPGGFALLGEF